MNIFISARFRLRLVFLLCVSGSALVFAGGVQPIANVPAGINHASYDRLLKKYVDGRGLIDYAGWKKNAKDLAALDHYLHQYARKGNPARGRERQADLINGYNAYVIRWILQNFPVESIWRTETPFSKARHEVNRDLVSLDEIEKEGLIPLIGWKAHAVLVCAARGSPPLQRYAYRADRIDKQIAQAQRVWLGREDLNNYLPARNRVEISPIFKWYPGDFATPDSDVRKILEDFGPRRFKKFLSGNDYTIKYKSYDWGLNDQGSEGKGYSRIELLWDNFF